MSKTAPVNMSELYDEDIERVLFSKDQIKQRLQEVAAQIDADYAGKDLLVIGIMKGALFTLTGVVRQMKKNVDIDFITLSSYEGGTKSSGNIKLVLDLDENIEGRNILVVEDITDTCLTMKWMLEYLKNKKAASVEIFTLLDKKEAHKYDINIKYIGFDVPKEFVVGFGLDYNQYYRNIPYIGVLKERVYAS